MKKSSIIGLVVVVLLLIFGVAGCNSYNGMVNLDEEVNQTWANVENQYQRRADLIPNLVNTVKGYAAHESSTLEAVTNARAGLTNAYNEAQSVTAEEAQATPEGFDKYQSAQNRLKGALDIYVNAVREAYPDLKANQNFLDLQTQLEGTENRIATERTRYNEAVKTYNVKIRRFPASIFAGVFGFSARQMFKAEEGAQKAPKVEF